MPEIKKTEERITSVRTRGTNVIVTVSRPVLTPEEREKRMNELKRATAEFLRAHYEAEARNAV